MPNIAGYIWAVTLALIIAIVQLLLFTCDQVIYLYQVDGSSHPPHLLMAF